jgi:hypothetical protein
MTITNTRIIVSACKLVLKKGTVIFNDKLKDGRRSVKVWGWDYPDYQQCQDMLVKAGYDARIIKKSRKFYNWLGKRVIREVTRIHVNENY